MCEKNNLSLLILYLIITVFLYSQIVLASDYDYHTGIEAIGYQEDQAYYGAGFGANVNSFSGSLILSSTDASILGANGLGASFTRTYNSQILFDLAEGDILHKPGPLGYGWSGWHMGKIRVPFRSQYSNPPQFYMDDHFYFESSSGSRQLLLNNGCNPDFQIGGSNCYWLETLFENYDEADPYKEYVFLTADRNKVLWEHNTIGFEGNCLKSGGDSFIMIGKDSTKYYFTHHVLYNSQYSDYTESSESDRHMVFPGAYLTKIEDVNGNYVKIEYTSQTTYDGICQIPGHRTTTGSPFISRITTYNSADTQIDRINFYYADPATPTSYGLKLLDYHYLINWVA